MDDFPSLKEQAETYKAALLKVILDGVTTTSQWIAKTVDPQLGDIGRQFTDRFIETGCTEICSTEHEVSVAIYTSHSLTINQPYRPNSLVYGLKATQSLYQLFLSQVHEKTHAIQKKSCAALHANLFNKDTKIIVCPQHSILLNERSEEQAYAIEGLFSNLAALECEDIYEASKAALISAAEFKAIVDSDRDMHSALIKAAEIALGKAKNLFEPDGETFKDHYHADALNHFQNGLKHRRDVDKKNFVYVRLEPQDIYDLGACCGHNTFGKDTLFPEFFKDPELNEENAARLAKINAACGIDDENNLPTLRETLAQQGLTPEQFIDRFYQQGTANAPSPQPTGQNDYDCN